MIIFVKKKESRIQCNFPTIGPNLYELCNNFTLLLCLLRDNVQCQMTKPGESSGMFKNL